MCLNCGHACLEQGFVESDLHVYGVCEKEFRSYKLLVCNPLAVFEPRLAEGYLCSRGPDQVFASIAQSDPGFD